MAATWCSRRGAAYLCCYVLALFLWHQTLSALLTPSTSHPGLRMARDFVRARHGDSNRIVTSLRARKERRTADEAAAGGDPAVAAISIAAASTAMSINVTSAGTQAAALPKPMSSTAPPSPPPMACSSGTAQLELDGDVIMDGVGKHGLSLTESECCEKCARVRGCNIWVACISEAACGRQCWLKWTHDPATPAVRGKGSGVPWASGTLLKDIPSLVRQPSEDELGSVAAVALRTEQGDIRIRLRPDWHLPSVRYVQHVALTGACTVRCVFYRGEPRFLLQGGMRAVINPNTLTQTRPKGSAMLKGHVAWAGGGSGPDLFITLGHTPTFGGTHTVWGEVPDVDSMRVVETLVGGKAQESYKQGQMRLFEDPVHFTVVPVNDVK